MSAAPVLPLPSLQSPEGRAQGKDVDSARNISRSEQQHWSALCDHRNSSNLACPGIPKLAQRCRCGVRTTQRALRGLEKKGWIGRPEGFGGGRAGSGSFTVYHLHRDGRPCQKCAVAKQRQELVAKPAQVTEIRPASSFSAPERRVSNDTETGVKSCDAYKEEPLKESLSQATTVEPKPKVVSLPVVAEKKIQEEDKPEPLQTVSNSSAEWLQDFETEKEFKELLAQLPEGLRQSVGYIARKSIKQALDSQGISLAVYRWAILKHGLTWIKSAGGLITFAQKWDEHTREIEWPCTHCSDSGTISHPGSPYDGLAPCTCKAGREKAQNGFQHFAAWLADPTYCLLCNNTGTDEKEFIGDNCRCAAGQRRAKEQREMELRRKQMEADGICTFCEGARKMNGLDCYCCKGTGKTMPVASQPKRVQPTMPIPHHHTRLGAEARMS
jgi:hypothetical protein